jgi:hypothetical protein
MRAANKRGKERATVAPVFSAAGAGRQATRLEDKDQELDKKNEGRL